MDPIKVLGMALAPAILWINGSWISGQTKVAAYVVPRMSAPRTRPVARIEDEIEREAARSVRRPAPMPVRASVLERLRQ